MIEKRLGIQVVPGPTWTGEKRNKTSREIQVELRGSKLIKTQIKEAIKLSLKNAKGVDFKTFNQDFLNNLRQRGIKPILHKHKTGEVYGLSFQMKDKIFKSSSLGKVYQYKQLKSTIILSFQSQLSTSQKTLSNSIPVSNNTSNTSQPYIPTGFKKVQSRNIEDDDEEEEKRKRKRKMGF